MKAFFALFFLTLLGCGQAQTNSSVINEADSNKSIAITNTGSLPATPKPDSTPKAIIVDTPRPTKPLPVQHEKFAGPATIVYKTKADYYDKVPVIMNAAKTEIVSYPAPTDIYYNGQLSYPTKLSKGYLLDNRGVNANVAFLNITYKEYSKLNSAPTLDEMMNKLLDKNPLLEMYNGGGRYQYKNGAADLNKIIDNKQLNKFSKLF